jgi:hypothetical protein
MACARKSKWRVAVGAEVTVDPRTDPYGPAKAYGSYRGWVAKKRRSTHRKKDEGYGMRHPAFDVLRKARPGHPVPLTQAPKHAQPEMDFLSANEASRS